MNEIKVRNKNAIFELLKGEVVFNKILMVENLKPDNLTKKILEIAKKQKVPVEIKPWKSMEKGRSGGTFEVIVGLLSEPNDWSLNELLADLTNQNRAPFFLLLNRVSYSSNIGFIARTAF